MNDHTTARNVTFPMGFHMVWLLTTALAIGGLIFGWVTSPEVLASRFSTTAPNAFMSSDAFFGFGVGLVLFMNGSYLTFAIPAVIRRIPESLWNVPDKAYWFRPGNYDAFVLMIARSMAQLGIFTNVLMGVVFAVVLAFNHGLVGMTAVNFVVFVVLLVSFGSIFPFMRSLRAPA